MFIAWLLDIYITLRGRYEQACLGGNHGRVKWFPFGCLIKIGKARAGAEADTVRFIREHTTIPVPRVYISAKGPRRTYMVMESVDGIPLQYVWRELNAQQRLHIVTQLRDYVAQLRTLKPPSAVSSGTISSLYGQPYRDSRLSSGAPVGPFPSEGALNDFLIDVADRWIDKGLTVDTRRKMRNDHRIVFTHGDLAPRNILVKGDEVVALIDWEESGWMPEHWEFIKAMWCTGLEDDATWDEAVFGFLTREYETDWKIDRELTDYMEGVV